MLDLFFYNRPVLNVAQELIGKTLHFGKFKGIITETEAYADHIDEASHAFKGPTQRSAMMFGKPGHTYVYFIYGMYYCLNIVVEEEGKAGAVLIRGLKLPEIHLNGPGKICKFLSITKEHNGINLINNPDFYLSKGKNLEYKITPRIGISKAADKLWRFVAI